MHCFFYSSACFAPLFFVSSNCLSRSPSLASIQSTVGHSAINARAAAADETGPPELPRLPEVPPSALLSSMSEALRFLLVGAPEGSMETSVASVKEEEEGEEGEEEVRREETSCWYWCRLCLRKFECVGVWLSCCWDGFKAALVVLSGVFWGHARGDGLGCSPRVGRPWW